MTKRLSEQDYTEAAEKLGVETALIKALVEVESSGRGFLEDGRPLVMFEEHVFYSELKKAGLDPEVVLSDHPDICARTFDGKRARGPKTEFAQLEKARAIHEEAALRSASWGLFQIMGFNYAAAGFETVIEFVAAMETGEGAQLLAFCRFLGSNTRMLTALREKDWALFARLYNGAGYKTHAYDERLRDAYLKNGGK